MVAPMVAAAGIGALGSVLGGLFGGGGKSAKKAAQIQQQTAREQIAANDRMRAENLGILSPNIDRGERAGSLLEGILTGGPGALDGFDTFRNSGNYQFRMDEGLRALNTGYAGKGVLDSGAARMGIVDYAGKTASGELGNWMNQLFQQQQVGVGAAGAATGQNITFQNMNNQASQNAADAASNAALIAGQYKSNMWNGIGQAAGMALGGMGKSSYGGALGGGITTTVGNSPFKGWI